MKRNVKKSYITLLIVLSMSFIVLSGCKNKKDKTNNITTEDGTEVTDDTISDDSSSEDEDNKDETEAGDNKEEPKVPETKEVLVYGIQNETLESEQVPVAIPKESEVTSELIVSQVVDLFADNSIEIGIDNVLEEGDKVIVSFQKDKAPLSNVGSGVELTILDSISKSLLDNLDTCNNVIFRVEGQAYESGHIELEKDEVYKWK